MKVQKAILWCSLLTIFFGMPSLGMAKSSTISENAFGANIHLRQRIPMDEWDTVLEKAEKAGVTWAREEFEWDVIEPTDGSYSFDTYDAVVAAYQEHDIEILGLLTYSSNWASTNPGSPYAEFYAPEDAAWREYVGTVAAHYAGDIDTWEIWNEPNHSGFFRSELVDYAALLVIAEEEIKKYNPDARVVLGGLSGADSDYLHRLLNRLPDPSIIDVVAIHPYRQTEENFNYAPEATTPGLNTLLTDLHNIRAVMLRHDLNTTPIWLTETGWTTYDSGVNQQMQAQYLMRLYTIALSVPRVKKVFWYAFTDTSENGTFQDAHFGLTTKEYARKKSFAAFQFIKRHLKGYRFTKIRLPQQEQISDFSQDLPWVAADEVCTRTTIDSNTEKNRLRVDYIFRKKINCYAPIVRTMQLPAKTRALLFSARGSNDPTQLRVRVVDSAGETFQYDAGLLPDEWSYYIVQLNHPASHWGGDNDGVLDYPLFFQSFVLDNGAGSTARGRALFDNLFASSVGQGYQFSFRKGDTIRHALWRNAPSKKISLTVPSSTATFIRPVLGGERKKSQLQSQAKKYRVKVTRLIKFLQPL